MSTLKANNVKLAKEYIHTFVYDKDFSIVDDLFEENCAIYNNFGFSLGPNVYVKKCEFLQSFKPIKLKIYNEIAMDHCAVYHYEMLIKHVKPYGGIKPTGNEFQVDVVLNVKSAGKKIDKAFISTNIESAMKHLLGLDESMSCTTMKNKSNPNILDDVMNSTCQYIRDKNILVGIKGLKCLCLWFVGKSDSEMGHILKLSRRTINYHQDRLKLLFNCYTREQLFEKIIHLNLANLLNECYILLMAYTLQEDKTIIELRSPSLEENTID